MKNALLLVPNAATTDAIDFILAQDFFSKGTCLYYTRPEVFQIYRQFIQG